MFLSIIIPIWNDEKYLAECLDSCLNQDIGYDDYEIICIDDGSTDSTPEILKGYASRYPNIHVITKQHGTAYGFGRNIGYERSIGDFLWFVDHDDIIAPNCLKALKSASEAPESYDRIAFPYYEFYNEMTDAEKACLLDGTLHPNNGDTLLELALWSGIIRTSFLKSYDIWPHSKRNDLAADYWGISNFDAWGGDNVCMEECFDNGMCTRLLTGRPFYHYRRHDSAQTMSLSKHAIEKRDKQKLHSALLRGYLAIQLKEKYFNERKLIGQASAETTIAMILKIRRSVSILSALPSKYWNEGIGLLKSKGLFFRRKPEEYSFSFNDYLKTRSLKEKLSPATYAYYYMFTLSGARLVRFLSTFKRLRGRNESIIGVYRKVKRKKNIRRGTSEI